MMVPAWWSMKRFLILFAFGAVVAAVGLLALPRLISVDRLATEVIDEVERLSGLHEIGRGEVSFVTFPWPRVRIRDLDMAPTTSAPASVTIPVVQVDIRLRDLFAGRIRQRQATLTRPDITIDLDRFRGRAETPDGRGAVVDQIDAAIEGAPTDIADIRLGHLTIVDGTFRLEGAGRVTVLSDADLTIELAALDRPLTIAGALDHRDERVSGSLSTASLIDFFAGRFSGTRLQLAAPISTLSFDGAAAYSGSLIMEGRLIAGIPALDRWLAWLGYSETDIEGLENISATADMSLVGSQVALGDLSLSFDGNSGQGSVIIADRDGALDLTGTLDFDTLNLTRVLSPPDADRDAADRLTYDTLGRRLSHAFPDDLTADLRLSANQVRAGSFRLGASAATAHLEDRKLTLGIGETRFLGGRGMGTLTLAPDGEAYVMTLTGNLREIDIGDMIDGGGVMALEGRADASAQISGRATAERSLIQALTGYADIRVAGGEVRGLDLARMARALEAGDLTGLAPDRRTSTRFETLSARFEIGDGLARSDRLDIDGGDVTLTADTQIDLVDLTVAGRGALVVPETPGDQAGDTAAALTLPFVITGPLSHPLILPDLNRLLRDRVDDDAPVAPGQDGAAPRGSDPSDG